MQQWYIKFHNNETGIGVLLSQRGPSREVERKGGYLTPVSGQPIVPPVGIACALGVRVAWLGRIVEPGLKSPVTNVGLDDSQLSSLRTLR